MKVPTIFTSMSKAMLPVLLDEAVQQLEKAKGESWPLLEVNGEYYLPKPLTSRLSTGVVILRRVYHAVLVLTGKAHAVQFAEDYGPLKKAARRVAAAKLN